MAVTEQKRSWARRIGSLITRIERDGVALWFACKHPKTPLTTKAICVFVVAYSFSPFDLYDFNHILGILDDVILLPSFIWLAIKLLPSDVLTECRVQASEWLERERKPRIPWGIVFFVVVWKLVAYTISNFFQT